MLAVVQNVDGTFRDIDDLKIVDHKGFIFQSPSVADNAPLICYVTARVPYDSQKRHWVAALATASLADAEPMMAGNLCFPLNTALYPKAPIVLWAFTTKPDTVLRPFYFGPLPAEARAVSSLALISKDWLESQPSWQNASDIAQNLAESLDVMWTFKTFEVDDDFIAADGENKTEEEMQWDMPETTEVEEEEGGDLPEAETGILNDDTGLVAEDDEDVGDEDEIESIDGESEEDGEDCEEEEGEDEDMPDEL